MATTHYQEKMLFRENLLRALKALVREEIISSSRAREVAGVSAEYWREFVRGTPCIDEQVGGYIEELPVPHSQFCINSEEENPVAALAKVTP